MGALEDWFWSKGPVYLCTCAKHPMRRERALQEMSRIGVMARESYDDGTVLPHLKHLSMRRDTSRVEVGCMLALIKWLSSNDKSDGMWMVQDDVAFLRDVDLLTSLCLSLPLRMSYMRGICLGSRPRKERINEDRLLFSRTKAYSMVSGHEDFSWGMAYYLNSDVCRYIPRNIVEIYVGIATKGKMSIEFLPNRFRNPCDLALSKLHFKNCVPVCVPSSRLCVQDYGCERGICTADTLLKTDLYRIDEDCPGCFPDPVASYNLSDSETPFPMRPHLV